MLGRITLGVASAAAAWPAPSMDAAACPIAECVAAAASAAAADTLPAPAWDAAACLIAECDAAASFQVLDRV